MSIKTINLLYCCDCNVCVNFPNWRAKKFIERGYYRCKTCENKRRFKYLTEEVKVKRIESLQKGRDEWQKNNPEKLSEIGKQRNAKVKTSRTIIKQKQDLTIKSDPEKYKEYCAKRSRIAKQFHTNMSDVEKELHYNKIFKNTGRSKAEDSFFSVLEKHGLLFARHTLISGFIVDGVYNKIILEFYGDSFHCNPLKYRNPQQYCSWIDRTVEQQWERDRKRLAVLYKHGFSVIIVWERDWNKNPSHVIERIKHALLESRDC